MAARNTSRGPKGCDCSGKSNVEFSAHQRLQGEKVALPSKVNRSNSRNCPTWGRSLVSAPRAGTFSTFSTSATSKHVIETIFIRVLQVNFFMISKPVQFIKGAANLRSPVVIKLTPKSKSRSRIASYRRRKGNSTLHAHRAGELSLTLIKR